MYKFCWNKSAAASALLLGFAAHSFAHVTLAVGRASAGTMYTASFRVGHACAGSTVTTGLRIRMPIGFTFIEAESRAGWTSSTGEQEVAWSVNSAEVAFGTGEKATFVVKGRLPPEAGPLWFKVLQTCDRGSADWSAVPGPDGSSVGLPAARLEVMPPSASFIELQDAWTRPVTMPQGTAGVYVKILASTDARLVTVSSEVSDSAEIHEMRMDGDVMRMRSLPNGLEIPAGKPVELSPGGYHIMLFGLRRPLSVGETFPVQFRFVDSGGVAVTREMKVQVRSMGMDSSTGQHRH